MQLLPLLKIPTIRHAIATCVVVLLAAYIDLFFSFSHEYWITLTATLVCQTIRIKTTRQGMIVFLICLVAMLAATILKVTILKQMLMYFILSFIFMVGDYLIYLNRLLSNKILWIVIFILIWLIAGLTPLETTFMMKDRVLDMMIGGVIGMLGAQFILPIKIYDAFRESVIPILQSLVDYTKILNHYFKQPESQKVKDLSINKNILQMTLHRNEGLYPEWVYESGVNRDLSSGYQFFLLYLEWITESFVSINYLLVRHINIHSLTLLGHDLTLSMEKNQELLNFLIQYFKEGKIKESQSDFKTDIVDLEKTLKQNVPGSIELLDISPEYVEMTALVSAVKDLRSMLLQLLLTLPA